MKSWGLASSVFPGGQKSPVHTAIVARKRKAWSIKNNSCWKPGATARGTT
jgi:hypothetical protein